MIGKIGRIGMGVYNAEGVRDFCKAVAGQGYEAMSVGDYSDFSMAAPGGTPATGIDHARGSNADLPGATDALHQP